MEIEYLDVLNEKGESTGVSRTFSDVHKEGLIHRTAHVWILNEKKELLLQKRSHDNLIYADYWDISAAGHISAGEASLHAAIRETQEELGISIIPETLKYLFTMQEHFIVNNGTYINNEFEDIYLLQLDTNTPDIHFTDKEVSDVRWITTEEFKSWIGNEEAHHLVPHTEEYTRLLKYI